MNVIKLMAIIIALFASQIIKPMEITSTGPQSEAPNLDTMPQLVIEKICSYLSFKDAARLRRTCKACQNAWDHEQMLWISSDDICAMISEKFGIPKDTKLATIPEETLKEGIMLLNERLRNLRNPIVLDLRGQILTKLPESLGSLKQVKYLKLWGTRLEAQGLANIDRLFPELEKLDLSANPLIGVPHEISSLRGLKKLSLNHIPLSHDDIKNICMWFPDLQELAIGSCGLTGLPSELSSLPLKCLDLNNCGRCWAETLNDLKLDDIKNICVWFPDLEDLNISFHHIGNLPDEITNLHHLKFLWLDGNYIPSERIEKIKKLMPWLECST